jgi:hypothetical protein
LVLLYNFYPCKTQLRYALFVGVRTHVVIVRGGTVGNIYINGAVSATNSASKVTAIRNSDLVFGKDYRDGTYYGISFYRGSIDNVNIYLTALTAAQVTQNFLQGIPTASPTRNPTTISPTAMQTTVPTNIPSTSPTEKPTLTLTPTTIPPTQTPTTIPPTQTPTTSAPTPNPTTASPTFTSQPSLQPTTNSSAVLTPWQIALVALGSVFAVLFAGILVYLYYFIQGGGSFVSIETVICQNCNCRFNYTPANETEEKCKTDDKTDDKKDKVAEANNTQQV